MKLLLDYFFILNNIENNLYKFEEFNKNVFNVGKVKLIILLFYIFNKKLKYVKFNLKLIYTIF